MSSQTGLAMAGLAGPTPTALHYTYNKMYISSLLLWMSPLKTIKQENNVGIICNDLRLK